jgi:Mrp family chromosome partitioning ATPase
MTYMRRPDEILSIARERGILEPLLKHLARPGANDELLSLVRECGILKPLMKLLSRAGVDPEPAARTGQPFRLVTIGERRIAPDGRFTMEDRTREAAVRSRALMADEATRVLHVTSASGGEGVSTVARELVHAVSRGKSRRTLLLDANPGGNDQASVLGGVLPDIAAGYVARGTVDVVEIASAGIGFHAAALPCASDGSAIPDLGLLLRSIYDLIVVDCPPILKHPSLPDLSGGAARVLMVVRSEVSSVRRVQRAKQEIAGLNAALWGAILTGQRPAVPGLLEKWL